MSDKFEKLFGFSSDNETNDQKAEQAQHRKYELNAYILVSIGVRQQYELPTAQEIAKDIFAIAEESENVHQAIADNNLLDTHDPAELIGSYVEREFAPPPIHNMALAATYDPGREVASGTMNWVARAEEDNSRFQLTEDGEKVVTSIMEQHENGNRQLPHLPDVMDL